MGCAGVFLGQDPLYFLQLFHEVCLGVQPACGVQEHQVVAIGQAVVHGLEGHGGRVRAFALGEEAGVHPGWPRSGAVRWPRPGRCSPAAMSTLRPCS